MNPTFTNQRFKPKYIEEQIQSSAEFIPFFVLNETHVTSDIFDAEIHISEYSIHRSDRINRQCGGTAIYLHESIPVDNIEYYSDSVCDAVMLYNKTLNLVIIGAYRPPKGHENLHVHTSFCNLLTKIKDFTSRLKNPDIFILGDFNLPSITWETEAINSEKPDKKCAELMLRFMDQLLLSQHVHEKTRKDISTLDLILTNNPDLVHNIEVEKVSTKISDHNKINLILNYDFKTKYNKEEAIYTPTHPLDQLNFNKSDWSAIRQELSQIDWTHFENKNVNEMCSELEDIVTEICGKHTPKHKLGKKSKLYIPADRRAMIRLKKNLNHKINLEKYIKVNKSEDKLKRLLEKKSEVEDKIKISHENEEKLKEIKMLKEIVKNPKVLYSYAKRKSKIKCNVGPLEGDDGKLHDDPVTMANLLQSQYLKVFSNPEIETDINIENTAPESILEDIIFSEQDISIAIGLIPPHSSGGPDKFPAEILKECKTEISKPLYYIWRKSMNTGEIPHIYLKQTIIPIFKKGSKSKAENYRPVSLTSHIVKIFERVLRLRLVHFIEQNNIIAPQQYGFRTGRSCMSQLIYHFENLLTILEEHSNVDALYLDMSKAFDKVDHAILLRKLKAFGITGKVHNWITSFLSNRYQCVMIDGKKSREEKVLSGVTQGTVLGPILFILYINDITKAIKHCYICIFADDSKLVKAINNMNDKELFNEDIRSVTEWAIKNKMQLNNLKYQLLQYGKNPDLKTPYTIDESVIVKKSDTVIDLGVLMDENMTFSEHIVKIKNKGKKMAGFVLRIIHSRSEDVVMLLYKTYVRPHLEYACSVWSPYQINKIQELESIQRTVRNRIEGLSEMNYNQRLQKLNLFSLQRRRERYDIIHIWKIQQGIIPNDLELMFYETPRQGWKCRRKSLPKRERRLSTLKFHSFSSRAASLFNSVPKSIKESKTIANFKLKLDKYLRCIPDTPPVSGYVTTNHNSLLDWATCDWDGKGRAQGEDYSVADLDETVARGEEPALPVP